MLPNVSSLQVARAQDSVQQFQNVGKKLDDIKEKIADQQKYQQLQQSSVSESTEWDWRKSYTSWARWEDLEELESKRKMEQERMESLASKADVMHHQHDHAIERQFFELPEEEKFSKCQNHRIMGDFHFGNGNLSRAAERYEIAIALYEYCFPEQPQQQESLESMRADCLCQVADCYVRLGWNRNAIEKVSLLLRERPSCFPALLFRARAYRQLDEYDNMLADLKQLEALDPNDLELKQEWRLANQVIDEDKKRTTIFAKSMLHLLEKPSDNSPKTFDSKAYTIEDSTLPLEIIAPPILEELNCRLLGLDIAADSMGSQRRRLHSPHGLC